jgi:outer membrane lipoprotein LolB
MASNSRFLRRRLAWFGLAALFIGGCAVVPSSPGIVPPARETLDAFSLEGRFSLRHENKNYSGRLSWRHRGTDNTVLLSSPFGQGMAEITTRESGAQLTASDGKVYTANDAETLTRQVLGYPLPLNQLTNWVRGRDNEPGLSERDAQGRPLRLRYQDWRVEYGYEGDDPQAPPSLIIAERVGELELRLKIDEWNSLTP